MLEVERIVINIPVKRCGGDKTQGEFFWQLTQEDVVFADAVLPRCDSEDFKDLTIDAILGVAPVELGQMCGVNGRVDLHAAQKNGHVSEMDFGTRPPPERERVVGWCQCQLH